MRNHLSMRAMLCVACLFAASAVADEGPRSAGPAELSKLRGEIAEMIGPARCINLVQCRIAAVGVRPCGGPAEYVVYSWISTDKGDIETKIAEYNFLQEDLQRKEQVVGTCVVLPEPTAACVNGRCVLSGSR